VRERWDKDALKASLPYFKAFISSMEAARMNGCLSLDTAQRQQEVQSGIKNSWLRRSFTFASVTPLRRFRPSYGSVFMLTPSLCVKYGPSRHICQAEAMAYIARHTSVPVPKVYCAFQKRNVTYILMERIKGVNARKIWGPISAKERERLRTQLRVFLAELRSPPHHSPGTSTTSTIRSCMTTV
jgi:hypothetical protein